MEIIQAGKFSFNYEALDLQTGLNVAALVYDVTGSTNLLATVSMTDNGNGMYTGTYTAASNKIYMVIMAAYTDGTFATPIASRAPSTDIYNSSTGGVTALAWDYTTFDQNTGLYLKAGVYDLTTGSPVSSGSVTMTHIALGAYLGKFTGSSGETYLARSLVYTDGTYGTVDITRAPTCAAFQCFTVSTQIAINNVYSATLTGATLTATMVARPS